MNPRLRPWTFCMVLLAAAFSIRAEEPPQKSALALQLEAVDAQLQKGEWEKAAAGAREAAVQQDRIGVSGLVPVLVRLALAEAGAGRSDDAVWDWQIALNLSPSLSDSDKLAAFGDAGKLLAAHPLRRWGEAPAGLTVLPVNAPGLQAPRRTQGATPELSPKLREISVPKWLRLQAVIDEQGRLRDPVVVSPLKGMTYEILDAVRSWRFEPARKDGRPVATLYDLTVNPPSRKPLTELVGLQGDLAAIEKLLRDRQWEEAEKRGDALWTKAVGFADPNRPFLAVALALRALAEVGNHHEDEGICRWQAAQAIDPLLYHMDLSVYGPPGAVLDRNRWGERTADPTVRSLQPKPAGTEISRPEIVAQPKPQYTEVARRAGIQGKFIIETIIDESGRIQDPLVVAGPPEPKGLDAASLEALCGWRFRPAKLAGQPVRVYYVLTISYGISGTPPLRYPRGLDRLPASGASPERPEPFPPPVPIPGPPA